MKEKQPLPPFPGEIHPRYKVKTQLSLEQIMWVRQNYPNHTAAELYTAMGISAHLFAEFLRMYHIIKQKKRYHRFELAPMDARCRGPHHRTVDEINRDVEKLRQNPDALQPLVKAKCMGMTCWCYPQCSTQGTRHHHPTKCNAMF